MKNLKMLDNVLGMNSEIIVGRTYYFGELVNIAVDNSCSAECIRENYEAGCIAAYMYNHEIDDYICIYIEFIAPDLDTTMEYTKSELYDILVVIDKITEF